MHKPDYLDFCNLLDSLAKLYNHEAPDDQLCAMYWDALRDVSLDAVKACANLHTKRSKFFPKPAELRPKQDVPRDPVPDDGKSAAAARVSMRNWEEQLRTNEPVAKWRVLAAYLAQTDQIDPSTTLHSERMQFCRAAAQRLVREFGPQWCITDPHCMHAASRLLDGRYMSPGGVVSSSLEAA